MFYVATVISLAVLVWWLRSIVQPVLLALMLAYLINPVIAWCEYKWKWSRPRCVMLIFSCAVVVVFGIAVAVLPVSINQIKNLLDRLPDYATDIGAALDVFLWPTLVYASVQASDDFLLTPWLQGREMSMNFVTIILAVLIGAAVAGFIGMLLAVPAAACVRIFWAEVVRPRLIRFAERH